MFLLKIILILLLSLIRFLLVIISYHNYSITKLGANLLTLATANDNTIEAFRHKKLKVIGIMWHPERYNKIKSIDKKYLSSVK